MRSSDTRHTHTHTHTHTRASQSTVPTLHFCKQIRAISEDEKVREDLRGMRETEAPKVSKNSIRVLEDLIIMRLIQKKKILFASSRGFWGGAAENSSLLQCYVLSTSSYRSFERTVLPWLWIWGPYISSIRRLLFTSRQGHTRRNNPQGLNLRLEVQDVFTKAITGPSPDHMNPVYTHLLLILCFHYTYIFHVVFSAQISWLNFCGDFSSQPRVLHAHPSHHLMWWTLIFGDE